MEQHGNEGFIARGENFCDVIPVLSRLWTKVADGCFKTLTRRFENTLQMLAVGRR